jgi:hypothetical protein
LLRGEPIAIDQEMCGTNCKSGDRQMHRPECRIQDIDPINGNMVNSADANGEGLVQNLATQSGSLQGGQLLRVIHPREKDSSFHHNRRGYHRARKRASSRFVHPRDSLYSPTPHSSFMLEHDALVIRNH